MKVIKIGGGCLKGNSVVGEIIHLIAKQGKGDIFVLSALSGVTNILVQGMEKALKDEKSIPETINLLRKKHHDLARYLVGRGDALKKIRQKLAPFLTTIERYLFGLNFTREATPRMQDMIACQGERLSVLLISEILKTRKIDAGFIMPEDAGIITDGKFKDATALLPRTSKNLKQSVLPHLSPEKILLIPGFYGISESNEITTFGRGGSDYSAAVVAAAMDADILEIWKDTKGFMSADPSAVPGARLIPELSYGEAAELAYSGAGILHPRTVEPVRKKGIAIAIKNTLHPDGPGSLITARKSQAGRVIKSVSHTRDISILKVHASGVGARPGILAQIAGSLSRADINIKSVVTSQTCISLLLSPDDIKKSHTVLKKLVPRPFRELEKITDIALISIVGEGLHRQRGIAAGCFTAVSHARVNIEMISFGPSKAALYFMVREKDLETSVNALHNYFFTD